jgi:eukaryotic-like serine/threonine-protein kinase
MRPNGFEEEPVQEPVMPDKPLHDTATLDRCFEGVVEEFLREREAGQNPDTQRYLERFPDVAPLLRDFFAGQDLFDRLAPDLAPCIRAAPAAISLAIPALGECVGGFELIEELGRGGMGVVYRARQTTLDRVVALKMIRRGPDEAELARFRVEAEAIARLQHPNIVQIYEVGEHDGMPFFTLEYCGGGSLAGRLRGTALLPAEAATVVAVLAGAMQAAHQHNVIHRDLKPANVLLAGGDAQTPLHRLTPKVSDFGLARMLDDPALTRSGVIMGTPSYMAPEQACGRPKEVGPAADVYALGAILYECLTGRPPFRAATTLDTLAQVLDTDPVPPRQLNPAVPRDLETISLKCLHKEARRRYADAAALADDLGRFLTGEPIRARPVGLVERSWRWCRRNPAWAAAAMLGVLLLLAPIVIAAREKQNSERIANALRLAEVRLRESRIQSATSTLERALLLCERGDINHGMLWLAQGLQTACLAEDENLEQAFRWNLGAWAGEVHRLDRMLSHPAAVDAVACSPDGTWLATGCGDGKVRLWDVASGQSRGELGHPGRLIRSLAFHPGGELLLTSCGDGKARLWAVPSGRPVGQPVTHAPAQPSTRWPAETGIMCVAFSPDGKTFATAGREGSVRLWETASCTPLGPPLIPSGDPVWVVAFRPDGQALLTGQRWDLQQWDLKTRNRLGLPMSRHLVFSAAYRPDGKSVVAGYLQDRAACQWDLSTGKAREPHMPHSAPVFSVCYSPDGRLVLTGSEDQTARLWDAASGQPLGSPLQHTGVVTGTAFSPDGKAFATSCRDGLVRLWKVAPGAQRRALPHPNWVRSVAFSPDGKRLLTGGADNFCRQWNPLRGHLVGPTLRQSGWGMGVAFSADGKIAYGLSHPQGGGGEHLYRWDVESGRLLGSAGGHHNGWRLAIDPSRTTLVTGGFGAMARIWDTATGQVRGAPLRHSPGSVEGVAIDPTGRVVLTGGEDKTIRSWDALTGEPLGPPVEFPYGVSALACSPDGKRVLVGSQGNYAQLWERDGWKPAGIPLPHRGAVNGVAFAAGGNLLVSCSNDNTARLWYALTSHPVGPSLRHRDRVSGVAVSPDGTLLATASDDFTAKVWAVPVPRTEEAALLSGWVQALTGQELDERGTIRVLPAADWQERCRRFLPLLERGGIDADGSAEPRQQSPLFTLSGHGRAWVNGVGYSPNGKHIVTASGDRTAKVWDAETRKEIFTLKGHKGYISGMG